jgi:hypothetical protein
MKPPRLLDDGPDARGWRPIKTAPKGEKVLLFYPAHHMDRYSLGPMLIVGTGSLPRRATHWQPLPEPPEAEDATG